jgi:predicted nucleic acid-binding protein
VIAPDRLVLLDTNVLLLIARGKAAGRWLMDTYALGTRPERPLLSIVSLGELRRIGTRQGWGESRFAALDRIAADLLPVGINDRVVRGYAEAGAHLDAAGLRIPQNDLWIAATASASRAVLLTTDSDFDRLHPRFVERELVPVSSLPRG